MNESKPKEPVRPHVADGIQEYDNPLPKWWLMLLYATIIWSVGYMAYYHFGSGSSLEEDYLTEVAAADAARASQGAANASSSGPDLAAKLKDAEFIASGREVYTSTCAPCHGALGEGGIGPNLTDEYWLHGGDIASIVDTIAVGVPAAGMPAWQPVLGDKKVEQLAAFILSIIGSNPPNAKAPQGDKHEAKQ